MVVTGKNSAAGAWVAWTILVKALSKYQSEEGEQTLVKSLADDRWEVAKEAIVGLAKLRTPLSQRLIPFFTHELADMRIAAAAAAGEIGDPVVIPHLKALLADPDTGVQKTAARALRQIETATKSGS